MFKAFEAYDFENDLAFQTGLKSIPNNSDPRVLEQAKIFYYSKAVAPLNSTEYTGWKAANVDNSDEGNRIGSHPDPNDAQRLPEAGIPGAPYSASFAEVVDMIVKGKEIPGIRDIPDKLNDQKPSESTSKAPPKPWEIQHQQQQDP
ncbi:hypothetical protein EV178_000002 [Coemansia sp. RSA 1646]|nr:hypothetical protein EV178_000002 [Coemansia sp. RSA 1646]